MSELTSRLGFGDTGSVFIITADDLGLCHAANTGVYDALSNGLATSASLLIPAPWAREAAARYRGEDVGVALAITSEHELLRYGPITHAPSLLGGDGGFAESVPDALDHADVDEVRRECRAQLERAILFGFDVSHLAAHHGALVTRPEFFDLVLELAEEYRLPLRLPTGASEHSMGFPARALAQEAGVVVPDRLIDTTAVGLRDRLSEVMDDLSDGVTEIVVHPATDTDELRAFAEDASLRVDDLRLLTREASLKAALRDAKATLIGWRPLLDLARRDPAAML